VSRELTASQFALLTASATAPIYLVAWEHSGIRETLSMSGDIIFADELYTGGDVTVTNIKNGIAGTLNVFASTERIAQVVSGTWRGSKECKIYNVPASLTDGAFMYATEDAILELDGIINSSGYSGNRITVQIVHKYFNRQMTPRNTYNEITEHAPPPGTMITVGTDKYVLKSTR